LIHTGKEGLVSSFEAAGSRAEEGDKRDLVMGDMGELSKFAAWEDTVGEGGDLVVRTSSIQ
jgi:hypothetical protein